MPLCEQFIYTSAEIDSKKGYQIIAKSPGISDEIISEMSDYFYPIGISPDKFTESQSLLLLRNNWIAYSRIKNIGMGYDGRSNTLYNHTILIRNEDFREFEYDSRILDAYYVEMPFYQERILMPINIERKIVPESFPTLLLSPQSLETLLKGLFRRQRIAILKIGDIGHIQNILTLLPISLRLISFSTLVVYPDKQPRFNLIEIPKQNRILLRDDFVIIDPHLTYSVVDDKPSDEFEKSLRYVTDIIMLQNSDLLKTINEDFEKIPGQDFYDKIILVSNYQQLKLSLDHTSRKKHAYTILQMIEKLDEQTALKYLEGIKESLADVDVKSYYLTFKINKIISESLNQPLVINNIEKMFNKLEPYTHESRFQLLTELVNVRKMDFLQNGKNLLIEACSSYFWHADEIIKLFLELEVLRKSIHEILGEESKISKTKKYEILTKLLEKAIEYNPGIIVELLDYLSLNPLIKGDIYGSKKIVENLYSTRKFYAEINPEIILKSTDIIISKIENSLLDIKLKKKNNENLNNLLEISGMLLNTLNFLKTEKMEKSLQNRIDDEKKKLEKIITQYEIRHNTEFSLSNMFPRFSYRWPYYDYATKDDVD